MREYRITNHLKGDVLIYKPQGLLGWLIALFAGTYSHVSIAVNRTEEIDAAVEAGGVTRNLIDWQRKPHFIPLPYNNDALVAALSKYGDDEYGKGQVVSKAVTLLLKNDKFLVDEGVDCSEFIGYYLTKHPLYSKAVGKRYIGRRLERKLRNPGSITPKLAGKAALAMAKVKNRKARIIKRYRVQ